MANPKRTYSTVYNALKQISDEEGIDFGLGGYTEQQFKDKYFTGPGNINNLYNKLSQISDEEGVDFGLGTRDEWLGSFGFTEADATPRQGYKPTAEEMAGFSSTIRNAGRTAGSSLGSFDNKVQNLQNRQGLNVPSRIEVGKSNNLVQGKQQLNPETGQLENTYITSSGNEYANEALADMEQRQIDQNLRDERYKQSLPGQIDDAYAERDRLNAELAKLQGQWVDQDGRVHYGNRGSDEAVASLEAALRQNQQRITALEAERDDDGGTQFWRGFIDAAQNPSTLTFGMSDFGDMVQLMRIKNKMDTAVESGQQTQLSDAEQSLLESSYLNNYAQQQYGENRGFMYRAGGISMQALPFVAEFMATGGMGAISQKGAELGTRAAEKLALQGLSKSLVKNLGVLAGDVAAGWAMANTTGIFRTAGDVMQRNMGGVTINPEGQYDFGEYDEDGNFTRGGKSLGRSIYEAEVANTLEYYTEKLGEHLQIGKWLSKGADKMGLSKLSKVVNYLSGNKWLERGGIQDYPSEVVEEEANLLLNGLLVGDNNLSTEPLQNLSNKVTKELFNKEFFTVDPNSKEYKESAFNPKTQLDIWGGMLFSIGLMQAPRLAHTGYSAAGYYAYKKNVDMADGNASVVFGADNWQMIKDEIDNCENDRLSDLMQTVINGDMTDVQKTATLNYAKNLVKMRGYNMGMMAGAKDEEETTSNEGMAAQAVNQSYQQGHETQDPDLMKQFNDDILAAEQNLHQYGEEFAKEIVDASEIPVQELDYLMNNRHYFTDEQIAAAADYYTKQSRAKGMMEGALDRIDLQVEQANAEVRANTHQQTGNVVMAKGNDNLDYCIVGGDIVTNPETGLTSLTGTGGAVVVRDQFGNVSVKSPQDLTVYSMQPAEELINTNETVLRQQLMQQADDDITFGSPANEVYQLEDVVTLQDANGNTIVGEIGMMPNASDGVYVVYTTDGKALQYTANELNRMIVAHNGMEVQRASAQPETQPVENQQLEQNGTESVPTGNNQEQPQPQPEQGGEQTGGEASAENGTGADEPPASALSRIPVLQDEKGKPVLNKKGKPQYQWHKASVEDAAAALIETTGGDMVMARDTASDLVKNAQAGLEKIRKQKPKGDDPIEIAESRMEIKRQEQEQQAIIKQWQDVNQAIQKQMRDEAAARQAEIEAAKSEEQRKREAAEAKERKKKQDEIDRQRIREQIEKDKERRNKEYSPLVEARKEMADDADALAILSDTEPRSLDEWVSSLLRPHSLLWQDASPSEVGLQSELGLKRADMNRFMTLLGNKESNAEPFGKAVLDIYEALPEGMKNQYTDEDVRNTLLNLFNEGSSTRMMHLTKENRIEEARQTMLENLRRAAEAEMEAWAEAYHLTPEERETYEDFMATQVMNGAETEYVNQIIAENESNKRSEAVDMQPAGGTAGRESEGGEEQVQGQSAAETAGADQERSQTVEGAETGTGEPTVPGNNVSGGTPQRVTAPDGKVFEFNKHGVCVNPNTIQNSKGKVSYKIHTAYNGQGWIGSREDEGSMWGNGSSPHFNGRVFPTEEECQAYYAKLVADEIRNREDESKVAPLLKSLQAIQDAVKPAESAEQPKRPTLDTPEGEILAKGGTKLYTEDGNVIYIVGSNIDKTKGARRYTCALYENDAELKNGNMITKFTIDQQDMRNNLNNGTYSKQKPVKQELEKPKNEKPNLDKNDYRTYMTPEAREYFANDPRFAKFQHRELAFVTAAVWDGVVIPVEELAKIPSIVEAEQKVNAKKQLKPFTLTDKQIEQHAQHLLDAEHGSAVYENGKMHKINGADDFTGAVRQERKAFVIIGRPAGGKSSVFANPLSNQYGARIIDSDVVKEWFDEFDDGYGAGYVQEMSSAVAERALDIAAQNGDNIILPRIGGNSVIRVSAALRLLGYDVQLYYNDVVPDTSYMRSTSRFAMTGRYLSLDYLTSIKDKPSKNFSNFAEETLGGYLDECTEEQIQQLRGRLERLAGGQQSDLWRALSWPVDEAGRRDSNGTVQGDVEERGSDGASAHLDLESPIFSYSEWKSNDVSFGEKPKEIWNSKSGQPMPVKEVKSNETESKVSAESGAAGEGVGQASGSADRTGTERGPESNRPERSGRGHSVNHKRIVSDSRMEELKKRLKSKLGGQLNVGVDPEILAIGAEMAVGYLERGVTKFADFARTMIDEVGDFMRPYLKSFYNAVRDMPEAQEYAGDMDDYQTVSSFDVHNFDKQGTLDALVKAQQIIDEKKVHKDVADITDGLDMKETTINDITDETDEQTAADTAAIVSEAETLAGEARSAKSREKRTATIEKIDKQLEKIDDQLAFIGFYDVDPDAPFHETYGRMKSAEKKAVADATRVARRIAKDLGINAKPTAKANIAPIGGDISFRIPINENTDLYFNLLMERGYESYPDSLEMDVSYFRLEDKNNKPQDNGRYKNNVNNFFGEMISYDDLLNDVRQAIKQAGIELKESKPAKQEPKKSAMKSKQQQANTEPTLFDMMFFEEEQPDNTLGATSTPDKIEEEEAKVDTNPTAAQKEAGNYQKGHIQIDGYDITIENPKGSVRSGVDANGNKWETTMHNTYGYIRGTEGVDGDHIDVFLSNDPTSGSVYVVDQVNPGTGSFDEHKVMYGFGSEEEAREAYLSNYSKGWKGLGNITEVSREDFKKWVESSHRKTKPFAEYKSVNKEQAPKRENNKRNNVGERGQDYAPTSPKARFNANIEAIRLMRQLNDEGIEAPTKEQMEVLRKYSGWGGMGTYFNDDTMAENKLLRDLLTEEEYNDAVMSINSAYYTPATVIDTLWDVAKALGFKGGNILAGSAGIGNIIGQMPTDISSQSNIEAVEIDTISGNILKLLYPDAIVHIEGFQDVRIPNGTVDLAVTNVPFVTGLHVIDKVDKDLSRKFTNIHDFCIAKNIRKLREGGIGIFITSSGTMDKSTKLREWIPDEGQSDVVGAFRLNNETFGGTNVTSDIIVVRKRVGGIKSEEAIDVSKASPLRVGSYEDKYGDEKQVSMTVNDYFRDHPEMMAGEMAFGYEKGDTFRPGSYGLYPTQGKSQEKMMQDFVNQMKKVGLTAKVYQNVVQATPKAEPNQLTAEKEGRMLIDDKGRLCVSRYGTAEPLGLNDQKVKGYTKQECFKDYQDVQKAVDDVLQQQLNDPDDAALKPKLDALNKAYDKFTKRYGTLHKNTSISFLRNDIDFPSFQALENYSETKDMKGKVKIETRKTPLFTQRVLGFKTEPQPKTVKDAVTASLFRTNTIDMDWIADKLGKSVDEVRKEILDSRLGFEDPSTGQVEIRYKYLSGNVREKLAIAEGYNTDGKYSANVEELRKAVPMDIPSHLIEFSLGSSWIPIELYKDYLKENYDLGNVKLTHIEGSWILDEGYSFRNEKNRSAGVYSEQFRETIYGHQLVAAALNNRPVKVAKQVTEGYGDSKTTRTVVDQAATSACAVRVDEIKDDFKQWAKKKMQDNPELAQRIEKIYNEKFNALVPMQIDDEFLPEHFEGSNVNISLYDHQKRGVMRGLTAPTMLAHEVGTGKSFTLISTAMEMRRLGTAKKPMIVVQNATVAQITADTKLLYPNAKVLSLTERDRDAEGRRAFYAKIKYNDWDVIIVPQSTFERIPDSPERELQFIQEKIDEKKHVIEAAEAAGADSRQMQQMKKELEKLEQEYGDTFLDKDPANSTKKKKKDAKKEAASLDKAETKAKEMLDRAVDDVQYFDDLGVDALLVDEAHEYKHLGFQTSIGRGIKGIDPSYSKKCAGLYNKTRAVYEKAGWKNVVFATGTPISNTAAEIWTFMKYLMQPDVMRQNDIYYFDDFVHNFGAISQMLEFATSGKFKENTRFAAYVNKPELIRIWSQVADTVLTKEVGEVKSKVPKKEGDKDQDVFLPQSPSLVSIMSAVRAELERFEKMTGKEKKENSSIPLTMYGIAKRAAIDPRLVNPDAPDEPLSKTNAAVKEIVKDLKATQSYKGTVAVFCDNQNRLGKTAEGKNYVEWNIYDDMRNKLIEAGVPAEQIAIIKSGMSITAKQKVFDAVNTGAIRVVLGSTQTLGTGVNMQERLHLLIHMDAPDRPMDYTQRNGRIERQGNLHKTWDKPIRILRFGVEDSLDVTAYQRLKTKSGFIDSIMDGKGALMNNQVDRTVEEEEEGLFDNPVAVLSGSQYALKKNQAERELRKYQGKKAQWEADQVYVANTLRRNKSEIADSRKLIGEYEAEQARYKKMFPDGKVKVVTVEGEPIDLSKGDADAYVKMVKTFKEKIQDPVNATVKKLRENPIYNDETLNYTVELDGHPINFRIDVYRTSEYENGKMKTVLHKGTHYKSADLQLTSDATDISKSARECVEDIMQDYISGNYFTERIETFNNKIDRLNEESEQLQKRVGMEFQYGKELEEAKKHVEEYTDLMKKEMEEKEAKYAAQQKEAQESGEGFDLKKAEDNEDEEVLRRSEEDYEDNELISRSVETFSEGQTFPIYKGETFSSYNVLGHRTSYSTDLMPDEYATQQALLDALRNQYPEYYVTIEDNNVRMQSFNAVMADAEIANDAKKAKGTKSYVERKTRRAIDAVEDMANRMGLDVEVLTTTEGLSGKDAKAKGIFNRRTHKITIILPNHKTQSDVINTLLHEGVAHYGLRKMFGENFNIFLDNVYNNVDPQIKARIDAAMKRNGWSRHTATEEYLARLAERTDFENATNSGWWQKIKDFFISMLAKAGFKTILTDNELRYILWRSYDNLLHPDSRRNIFDKARVVDMMNRLKVGGYEERVPVRTSAEATTRVADRVNEEMLNRDLDNVPSQELLLSLSQKEGDERNEAIDELARRVGSGEARIVRLGEEMERGRRTLCHRVGSVLGSQFFAESEGSDETLGTGMHQRTLETERQKAKEELQVKNDILSWAKRNGYYIDEKEVERNSLDGKIFRSAAESNVYRTKDGKKVVKFMIVSDYYRHGLMKRLDDLALQNALLSDPVDVIGFSENKNGGLNVVLEQDYIEGDTVLERFNGDTDQANDYIDAYLTTTLGLREWYDEYGDFDGIFTKKDILYKDIHGGNVIIDKDNNRHIVDCQTEFKADRFPSERMPGFSIEDNEQNAELYSLRTKEPPKKTGIGYKVFVLKNGQLYPPMVANPNGEGTPIGVWLDADAAPVAGTSKTGRPQVKAGGKGTQGGSGQLAYRPGWHLGEIPYALQFNRKDENGERTLFPNNFVWAEVEYADDVDYNEEARKEGTNASGKYQHSLAGLKHVPTDGSYKYRTNPDPRTDPWIITGAMRVNKILSREEVDELVRKAGREPQPMQEGDVLTQESIDALNAEIQAMKEADEMGLLYRDDEDGDLYVDPFDETIDVARDTYERAAASDALKFQEAWQDKMAGLKVLQNAIEKETGNKATGAEDAYLYENRMHGKAKNQSENYDRHFYRPLLKAADKMMKAKGWTEMRQLTDYLVAKHGLERNIFYAFKEAVTGMVRDQINREQHQLTRDYEKGNIDALTYKKEQQKLIDREAKDISDKIQDVYNDPEHIRMKQDYEDGLITYSDFITNMENLHRSYSPDFDEHYKDYSGLTELTGEEDNYRNLALAMVDAAEQDAQEPVKDLWDAINAATKETLRFAYESGTMSRNTYNNVRAMFDYYVPLRGWEEDNADDFYDYVSERNVFSTAIKKAYGRKSLAENPLAYIGNMAVSTLLAGHKNLMKQHFLNYVMNNPTSLVSVSEKWWENKGTETSPYWVEVAPEIPANATADEIADIVEAFNEDMKQKAEQGKATTRRGSLNIKYHATGAEKNEHMVEVQRAGKTYQLYINGNPKAAQALNGINEKAVSRISQTDFGKLVESINRSMAAFFTSKNPAFVLSNLSRDLTMAGASVAVKEDAAYNAQFIKNVWKVLRPRVGRMSKFGLAPQIARRMTGVQKQYGITGLMPSLIRKYLDGDLDLNNETERLFGEFMDEGGETGFVNMLSVDSFKEKMQKEIGQMQGTTFNIKQARQGTKETPIGKGLRMMGEIFEFYNRCAEDATRFIVYMTSRQMGKSLEDSIADAKDVTLNFNRKGTGSKWNAVIRDLFIFVNPAVQALANMFKMAYKHPLKLTAVTAAFVAGGALMPIINQWLLNLFGDDDDKDAYWNLPPWVRKNNLVLWVPGTKNFITIPLAQEFRVFYGLGELVSSLANEHPVHDWPLEILSSFMDLIPINPTGNAGNLLIDLTPTTFQPMSQLAFNTDFTGKPIWKENQGNKYAPMYTKAYVTTPEWMIDLSEAMNDLTGGNEGKKGWLEEYLYGGSYINNPAVWNHLLQGYFGGMYNTIAKTFDVGVTVGKGELPKVYQTPIVNRFLNRPVERDNAGVLGDEYYTLTEERDRLKYELRVWQKKASEGDMDAQAHVEEIMSSDDYQRMMVIDHYDKIMKDLRAGERAATWDVDKKDIKESITLYKSEMMEELAAIDNGQDPLEVAKQKYDEAKTVAEKNRLRLRIEKLMMRKNGGASKRRGDEVEKALSYSEDESTSQGNELYMKLATSENIADDARIRAARLKIKPYSDHYKELMAQGKNEDAVTYRKEYLPWFIAESVIQSKSRTIATNKKLLGKGNDESIMKLIDANRQRMLKEIENLP